MGVGWGGEGGPGPLDPPLYIYLTSSKSAASLRNGFLNGLRRKEMLICRCT